MSDTYSNSPKRTLVSTGSKWEILAGYSRAVKVGNIIEVAGTTSVNENGETVGTGDIERQTQYIFQKIEDSLGKVGAGLAHIVRTRMFVTDISEWEKVTKVHGEIFRDIRPVCTLVEVSKLIQPELLIEIEVTAIIS